MEKIEPINEGYFYHIYNRGINSCEIFTENENYKYFMGLYEKYLNPVAETYAWVLMPNHFHFLIRVIDTPERVINPFRGRISQQFSNLFNAYAQAFNKRNTRHGGLFESRFKRKLVDDETYRKTLILYIHNNPVHHGFCNHAGEYIWSSYLSCISEKPTKLQRESVISWFNDRNNFIYCHNMRVDIESIGKWLNL